MTGRERALLLAFGGGVVGGWLDQALGTMGVSSVLVTGLAGLGGGTIPADQARPLRRRPQPSEAHSQDHSLVPWAAWLGSWVAFLSQPPVSWMAASMISMSAMMGAMAATGSRPLVPRLNLLPLLKPRPSER